MLINQDVRHRPQTSAFTSVPHRAREVKVGGTMAPGALLQLGSTSPPPGRGSVWPGSVSVALADPPPPE